jgi:hypothetical protein
VIGVAFLAMQPWRWQDIECEAVATVLAASVLNLGSL